MKPQRHRGGVDVSTCLKAIQRAELVLHRISKGERDEPNNAGIVAERLREILRDAGWFSTEDKEGYF